MAFISTSSPVVVVLCLGSGNGSVSFPHSLPQEDVAFAPHERILEAGRVPCLYNTEGKDLSSLLTNPSLQHEHLVEAHTKELASKYGLSLGVGFPGILSCHSKTTLGS